MKTGDTEPTKFIVKLLGAIVSSALGADELFANVRHIEVIAIEKDLHARELLKLAVKIIVYIQTTHSERTLYDEWTTSIVCSLAAVWRSWDDWPPLAFTPPENPL